MIKPKLAYIYCGKLYITYRTRYEQWINTRIENKPWHMMEEWAFVIGKGETWFGKEDWYYDGHTFKGFTFCHVVLALVYTYQSEARYE